MILSQTMLALADEAPEAPSPTSPDRKKRPSRRTPACVELARTRTPGHCASYSTKSASCFEVSPADASITISGKPTFDLDFLKIPV